MTIPEELKRAPFVKVLSEFDYLAQYDPPMSIKSGVDFGGLIGVDSQA